MRFVHQRPPFVLLMKKFQITSLVTVLLLTATSIRAQVSRHQLDVPRLTPPFTLRFVVTEQDLRTRIQQAADIQSLKQQYTDLGRAGQLGDTDVPTIIARTQSAYEVRKRGWTYAVSISALKDRMLYQVVDHGMSITIIYDGKQCYRILTPGPSIFKSFGVVLQDLQALPFAGVNLPLYPWIRSVESWSERGTSACEVLPFRAALADEDHVPSYSHGTLFWDYQQGKPLLKAVTIGLDEHPTARFSFQKHTPFGGSWLARDSEWTTYKPLHTSGHGNQWLPWLRVSFSLTQASPDAPPPAQFMPESYGTAGCPVLVESKGRVVAFPFVPGTSIDKQTQDEKEREDRDAFLADRGSLPVQSYAGIAILLYVFYLLAAAYIRYRKPATQHAIK